MNRGGCWAIVHEVAKSQTQLSLSQTQLTYTQCKSDTTDLHYYYYDKTTPIKKKKKDN